MKMKMKRMTTNAEVPPAVLDMARSRGYKTAKFRGTTDGYNVYEASYDTDETLCIGFPEVIMEKYGQLKLLTRWDAVQALREADPSNQQQET